MPNVSVIMCTMTELLLKSSRRAPYCIFSLTVNRVDGRVEFAKNLRTRIADVERTIEMSTSRLNDDESELSNDVRAVLSVLKAVGGQEAPVAFPRVPKRQ